MYDKYFQANPITIGSRIPKHKGILFSGGTPTTSTTSTIHVIEPDGSTGAFTLLVNQSPYIFPLQVHTIATLASGMTAWYIN